MPVVQLDGQNYFEFLLDINEQQTGTGRRLFLDDFRFSKGMSATSTPLISMTSERWFTTWTPSQPETPSSSTHSTREWRRRLFGIGSDLG